MWRDLVTMFLCWKSPVPSLIHYNVPQPDPTCGLPAFLPSPDVSASMTLHPCVRHPLGCCTRLGFLRASAGALFTGLTVSWGCDTCVPQLSQSDTLELFPPRFTSLHGAETVSTDQHLRKSQVPRGPCIGASEKASVSRASPLA